jgi:hypothetical protein
MDLTTCEDEGTYMQLFEMSFTSPPFDTGFHSIPVTTDEEEEEEEAHIENEVEVVEIERSLWECPCCRNNHVAALALPCDHLVCGDCFPRLDSCPLCRDSVAGPSSVVPLTVRRAKSGQRAVEVDLTHDDEDEGASGASWCCPQCANLRTKGYSCARNECKAARCEDCWKRSQYKCVFCTIGTPSGRPLRL